MYTSPLVCVLSSQVVASQGADPLTWTQDYAKAQPTGSAQKKPLAVFVGSGATCYVGGRRH